MQKITRKALFALLDDQGYRCALTGAKLSPEGCALDHVMPIANGGSVGVDNVQFVTKEINQAKGSMDQDEFIEMCILVARRFE